MTQNGSSEDSSHSAHLKELEDSPALRKAFGHVIASRFLKAQQQHFPAKKYVSGSTKARHGALVRARGTIARIAAPLSAISIVSLFVPPGWWSLASVLTVLAGASVLTLSFLEVVRGAGLEREREYLQGSEWGRDYFFTPSMNRLRDLVLPLTVGFLGVLLGFGGLHSYVYRTLPGAYSSPVEQLGALYFSIVTFAAGVGDVAPLNAVSRILTALQIIISWVLVTVVLTTVLSWAIDHQLRQHDDFITRRSREVREREEIFRKAGLGLYGDIPDLVREAKERLAAPGALSTDDGADTDGAA